MRFKIVARDEVQYAFARYTLEAAGLFRGIDTILAILGRYEYSNGLIPDKYAARINKALAKLKKRVLRSS